MWHSNASDGRRVFNDQRSTNSGGAIQGEFEQGIFFTTSDFTDGAKAVSLKKGAVPIILLDGESIVDLMIDKQFGVKRRPMEPYLDEVDRLFGANE
jgi:restriction system protein